MRPEDFAAGIIARVGTENEVSLTQNIDYLSRGHFRTCLGLAISKQLLLAQFPLTDCSSEYSL